MCVVCFVFLICVEQVGNSAPSCHFELQCSVPVFELTALNKISAASEEKFLSEVSLLSLVLYGQLHGSAVFIDL